MKILKLAFEYPPILGGGATYAKNLAKALAHQGEDIILITGGDHDSIDKNFPKLTVKRYKVFKDIYYGKGNLVEGIQALIDEIKQETPDIIHSNHSVETLVLQIANLNFGLPHVVSHLKTPEYREGLAPVNGKWSLYHYVNNAKPDKFIASSKVYRDNLLQSGVIPEKIKIIYAGVDQRFFKPLLKTDKSLLEFKNKIGLSPKDIFILIPVVIRQRKGVEFALRSLSKLKIENKNIKVLVTGMAKFIKNSNKLHYYQQFLNPNELVIKESLTDKEMPLAYNAADLTILPSQAEGFGYASLESMACGCPLIGMDVIGTNEVIKNKINGRLVEYGNETELLNSVKEILLEKNVKNKYVNNALLSLKEKFNLDKQALEHRYLYEELLKGRKQSAGGVLYRKRKDEIEIYLLEHKSYGLVLPKGGKKPEETWKETAAREVAEETGYVVGEPNYNLGQLNFTFGDESGSKYDKTVQFYAFEINKNHLLKEQNLEKGERLNKGKWFISDEAVDRIAHESEGEMIKKLLLRL